MKGNSLYIEIAGRDSQIIVNRLKQQLRALLDDFTESELITLETGFTREEGREKDLHWD